MSTVLVNIEENDELMNGYQLIQDHNGFKVWVSTGMLSGYFATDAYDNATFETFKEAFEFLTNLINDEEFA
jgi:hypothetical protein